MAVIINKGWLILTNGVDTLKVYFQKFTAQRVFMGSHIEHYLGGTHYFYDMGARYWNFIIKNVMFDSHTDMNNAIVYLENWQDAGTFTLSVQRNSTGDFVSFDGDTTITVAIPQGGFSLEKLAAYNDDNYVLTKLQLEQAG